METIILDYLTPNISQIRHSIRGIDDSYNNYWDIFAELIQNAVDAIRQLDCEQGIIDFEVDCQCKSIKIVDNGIGIKKDELPLLLKPFGTNKANIDSVIGEKGVGLKFVIFSSTYFHIKTGTPEGSCEAEIKEANVWKNSNEESVLPLGFQVIDEKIQGTTVIVKGVDNDILFNLTFEQFKFVLQTRTAIGNTKSIWDSDKDIIIHIKYKDNYSETKEEVLPFKYWLITDILPESSKIDLDQFVDWTKQNDRTDQEKMAKVKDKVIYKKGSYNHSNSRIIKYYTCFVPKRRVWNEISVDLKLATEDNLMDESWMSDYSFCKLSNGIFVSVKGMPTGISVEHPTTGYAGYWANLFMIFEDPFVKFDIGRKSIHGRQANIHRECAKKIFNEFLQFVTKYVSGDIVIEPTEWNRDEIFSEIDKIVDLNVVGIKFLKIPSAQEASVAAIFYECIGNGKIQQITPLISGYRNKYDLYALWDRKKIIIEFKSHLRNLAKDFNDARKMFDEIDCVVCWEVTDLDKQTMKNLGVNVEEIVASRFASTTRNIPHSTHIMNLTGFVKPVYIIDLKKVLFP